MRVVHVAPAPFGLRGLFGGGERYPLELARALAGDVDTELVTFGRRPWVGVDAAGLRVRVLRAVTHIPRHPAHPVAPGLPAALRGADIVHTHHLRSAPSRLAVVAARVSRQRAVVTDHGLGGGGWAGLLPRLFHRFLTVSRYSADTLGVPADRVTVIYGGADPTLFRPDDEESREGVLFVGRLTPHKGVDRLLRALPDGVRLTCVGTGGHDRRWPERGYVDLLRRLSAGRPVNFAGGVSDVELALLYRRARLVVLPSVQVTCYGRRVEISELLGLSVLEAMASGTPVVCSRLGGLPEIVQDAETGLLVTPGDVAELREGIATLLSDPARAARMGRRARELVLDRYTWQACAARCLAAYEPVLACPNRS